MEENCVPCGERKVLFSAATASIQTSGIENHGILCRIHWKTKQKKTWLHLDVNVREVFADPFDLLEVGHGLSSMHHVIYAPATLRPKHHLEAAVLARALVNSNERRDHVRLQASVLVPVTTRQSEMDCSSSFSVRTVCFITLSRQPSAIWCRWSSHP